MSMIGNMDALEYAECSIPDMLGSLDPETSDYYERFVNRIRYLIRQNEGCKPKYHKGIYGSKYDYWSCGNCGDIVKNDVNSNYCDKCGFKIHWDSPRCLTK